MLLATFVFEELRVRLKNKRKEEKSSRGAVCSFLNIRTVK